MRKVLVTGMSGTGKSTALAELARRGFEVVDTDVGGWSEWSDADGGYVWREDLIAELLARDEGPTLYVSGTVSNQGRFYSSFHAVVLLSAPADVLLRRIETRTSNDFGKDDAERAAILSDLAEVEPLLRAGCTHELDATRPVEEVVDRLIEIGGGRDATIVQRADVEVMFKRTADEQEAIARAWAELEELVGSLRGRKFFGVFDAARHEYRVCVEQHAGDDANALGLETGTLAGGRYARVRLEGQPPAVYELIGPAFAQLAQRRDRDPSRLEIEFYRRHDVIDLLLPVI